MLHSPDDPRYVELTRQAFELFLRDMPVIHIAEELHVIVHNTRYWTGWHGIEDPYVAPYPPWTGWYLITMNLEPTEQPLNAHRTVLGCNRQPRTVRTCLVAVDKSRDFR